MDQRHGLDDLSGPMQRELDERITTAGGNVTSVRREVEVALADINRRQDEADPPLGLQADRALLMMELRYLDAKAGSGQPQVTAREGWLASLRASLMRRLGQGQAKNGGK